MKNKHLLIVPLLTLLCGFIPFLLLSIYYSVFLSKTIVDIPLIFNTSVMIGDAILLPLINYMIFRYMFKISSIIKHYKKQFVYSMAISLLISSIINIIIHFVWANDNITDFIAYKPGAFSVIGIWHLIFSILQTTVFFVFIILWYLSIKSGTTNYLAELKKIWLFIFSFTILSIVDMFVKFIFIFQDKSLHEVLILDKFAFVTPITAIGLFAFFNYYEREKKINDI